MPNSDNIELWKEKAEIDYIPPFMALWLSLNAWMKKHFGPKTDRVKLEQLKGGGGSLHDKFSDLIRSEGFNGILFRGYFGELHRALVNAHIPYSYGRRSSDKTISFESCIIEWNNGRPQFDSILVEKEHNHLSFETPSMFDENDEEKIKLDDELWVENAPERLFVAYIEIVYQVRCALFHADLAPNSDENKRVIKQLYLTLSMIMENI